MSDERIEDEDEITLIDGIEWNRAHPDTFYIPSEIEKDAVKAGDSVKIGFLVGGEGERMWVKVTGIATWQGYFCGMLDNKPLLMPIEYGDTVVFRAEHILDIIQDGDNARVTF